MSGLASSGIAHVRGKHEGKGLWSVQIVKGHPSKKYIKCFTSRKMASILTSGRS